MDSSSFYHLAGLFEAGITEAVSHLKPERAFVAYRGRTSEAADFPTPFATHGFSMAGLYTEEDISTEVIRKTLRDGESQLIVDAVSTPGLTNRTSVIIAGLRSVLTVPLRHSNGLVLGLFYLDNRVKAGAFKAVHQAELERVADWIVENLGGVEKRMKSRKFEQKDDLPDVSQMRSRALSLAEKGQYTEALSMAERWIVGSPEDKQLGVGYGVKGRILQQMGQMDPALEAVATAVYLLGQRATIHNEDYALVLNNLASLHVALDNLDRAHGLFRAAESYWKRLANSNAKHFSGLAATQYNLGRLHEEIEEYREAISWYENALVSSQDAFGVEHPKTQKVRDSLGRLKDRVGS